jgi:hydroxymethylglutaryl-CoA lyase
MTSVRIRDISPRLAFQAHAVETAIKVELVDRLTAAGVLAVEVSSFVNPRLVPGVADAADVFAQARRPDGVSLECCVANVRGLERAIDAGAHVAWFLLAVDDGFSRLNTGRGIEESLAELERMQAVAQASSIRLGSYLIHAFGGPIGPARVAEDVRPLGERLLSMGVFDWILADSNGYAAPPQIAAMVEWASGLIGIERVNVQVHDSRGMGLANVAELARLGVANIDLALAGSGGHPAAPDALVGGTCTEDAAQMLSLMNVDTGVDLAALVDAARWLDKVLGGTGLGFVRRTGAVPTAGGSDPATAPKDRAWPRTGEVA